jgi:nitrous oxide reductase accessory protein NosL
MKKLIFLSLSAFLLTGCVSTTPTVEKKEEIATTQTQVEQDLKERAKNKQTKIKDKVETKKEIVKKETKKKMPKKHHMHMNKNMFQTVDAKDAILLQDGPNKEHCVICGMNLVKFYKTSHAATLGDHKVQYCSIHCLANHIKEGAELENPMVVDVTSLKFIPVTEAYYVVGSDVRGTMSMVSKYAFKNLDDAKAFQKKHGGEIMDFYSAWQVAKKDFKK